MMIHRWIFRWFGGFGGANHFEQDRTLQRICLKQNWVVGVYVSSDESLQKDAKF